VNNLKISTRLSILIAVLSALLMAIGGFGLYSAARINDELKSVYEDRTVPLVQLGAVKQLMTANRLAVAAALLTPTPDFIASQLAQIDANIAEVAKQWDAYMASGLTTDEAKLAAEHAEHHKQFVGEGLRPAMAALRANDLEAAKQLSTAKVRALYMPAAKSLDALVELQVTEAKRSFETSVERYVTARNAAIVSIVLGVTFAALLGWSMIRAMSRQFEQAVSLARAVAAGDLSVQVQVSGKDEISQLLHALRDMQQGLARTVGEVRKASDSIATGSSEIATGNADLSQRTEEQASNLQQTAASMEQLTSTVKHNADAAQQARQLSETAQHAANKGGEVVGQVVSTMEQISASSRRINEIIGVIDSIAFQTNILALTAAVEAARAGEQGRGFAVVASEVRSLAQRSADAAKEIKSLIGASVERVDAGSALVGDAGRAIEDIVGQVKRVNDLVAEISAASAEQTVGIGQIGSAVTQLDQVTQQNAALVEESAAAAESLNAQAQQLKKAVAVFRLGSADDAYLA
jgi:methyl-accepting chemotaxis protein-1 (serine sensor receptor)